MIPKAGWCPGWLREHNPNQAAWSSMRGNDGVYYCGKCLRVKEPERYADVQARQRSYALRKATRLTGHPTYTVVQAREQCEALVARARTGESKSVASMRFRVRGKFLRLSTMFFDDDPPIVGGRGMQKFRWRTLLVDSGGSLIVTIDNIRCQELLLSCAPLVWELWEWGREAPERRDSILHVLNTRLGFEYTVHCVAWASRLGRSKRHFVQPRINVDRIDFVD